MNLYAELEKLLLKAKESNEYFNPNFLTELYETCASYNKQFDKNYELSKWIENMWSR